MNDKLPSGGLPPRHLEEVFKPPAKRSGNLRSILPPVPPAKARGVTPPAEAQSAPAEEAPAVHEASAVEEAPGAVEAVRATPVATSSVLYESDASDAVEGPSPTGSPADARKMIIVYMPAAMREWLRRAAVGSTQLYVVLSAVDQAERTGRLGEAIEEELRPDTSGLFVLPKSTKRGSTNVQVSLWVLESHIKVLNELTAKYNAPNRSAVVRAALAFARKQHARH